MRGRAAEWDAAAALRAQLDLLRGEQDRIRRRIESVYITSGRLERGERLVAAEVFEEFDRPQYFAGPGEMYVADGCFEIDDRHGAGTMALVRDAMKVYAGKNIH
ncbi:hypothetical protein [Nocardia sp. NPDC051750]|uniref:hypothetical protein n=1 Tax=Nocardia sp. NPDC051750 TaxID=3364325 RepID=UPI0037974577